MIVMEGGRFVFDGSAYMLFESSGDSEAADDSDAILEQEYDPAAAAEEEEDAQSCNYGSLCDTDMTDRIREVVDGSVEFDYYCSVDEEEYGGWSDEEDGVVDQCCRKAAAEELAKSKGFDESKAVMSEREGDKLFWEACLAS